MKQISFKEKYVVELETFYTSYPEVMKEQGITSLDHFIEEIAMYGMRLFQNNYRPLKGKANEK